MNEKLKAAMQALEDLRIERVIQYSILEKKIKAIDDKLSIQFAKVSALVSLLP